MQAQVQAVLLGPDDALQDRVDGLQVGRVRDDADLGGVLTVRRRVLAGLAQVVFHVAGAVSRLRVHPPFEFIEELLVRLPDDVGEDVEPAAVGHAHHHLVQPRLGGRLEHRVEQRDQRLAALEREPLLAHVLRLQERLERLGPVEPEQDLLLLLGVRLGVLDLDALLDPAALLRVLDVHVLDADPAAVAVAQDAEHVPEPHLLLAGETADRERPVQVPQGQAVLEHVQVGVLADGELERVGVGHQVTAHPVRMDQLDHPRGLVDLALGGAGDVADPADRLVRDTQRGEDLVVEVPAAEQQLVHHLEELAGLRALDDPVVIRAGQRGDLGDAVVGEGLVAHAGVGRRVLQGADADDGGLPVHQARDRVHRADAARVGQRDRGAVVVVHGQLVAAGTADDVLVGLPETAEVELLTILDGWDDQRPRPVLLREVDGDAEVHVLRLDQGRLAVDLGVDVVHLRVRDDRANQGPADQVGEADLATPPAGQVVVDHDAVVDHQLRRHRAHRGGGRDLERGLHVLHDLGGDAAQDRGLRPGRRRGDLRLRLRSGLGRLGLLRRGGRGDRLGWGHRGGGRRVGARLGGALRRVRGGRLVGGDDPAGRVRRFVIREEIVPCRVDAGRIGQVSLIHLVDDPLIGTEIREWIVLRSLLRRHCRVRLFHRVCSHVTTSSCGTGSRGTG